VLLVLDEQLHDVVLEDVGELARVREQARNLKKGDRGGRIGVGSKR